MPKTVIVSDETIRQLVEAHASLAAWYYQMSGALRDAGIGVDAPSEDQRRAFVQQMGEHFPEIAQICGEVTSPRPYVPPPVVPAPAEVTENEGVTVAAPPTDHQETPAMVASEQEAGPEPEASGPPDAPNAQPSGEQPGGEQAEEGDVPPPPPIVDPSKVKYE